MFLNIMSLTATNTMILQTIRERAAADLQHIILPEGDDVRTIEAAAICAMRKRSAISRRRPAST
jgi:hypothetical protein